MDHPKRYIKKSHLSKKPRKSQLNTFGGSLWTFKYKPIIDRDHLSTYIVQAK